ncbi:MAG: EI24 domain-containing protein [Janthinobacterium lividum]
MDSILIAFGRALWSQLHYRMLLLTVMPFVLSVVLWGAALYFGYQPMLDWLQAGFAGNDGFRIAGNALAWLGMDAMRAALVPLIALWVLLPLMILTALVFVGTLAMPAITRHVGQRAYPLLEQRHGGSILGSVWLSAKSFLIFVVLWLVTLPLNAIPPLTFVIQPLLWGWLTSRVMSYDVLADHASANERRELLHALRWPLLVMGTIAGAMGAAPTLLWLGGALTVLLLPRLAGISI